MNKTPVTVEALTQMCESKPGFLTRCADALDMSPKRVRLQVSGGRLTVDELDRALNRLSTLEGKPFVENEVRSWLLNTDRILRFRAWLEDRSTHLVAELVDDLVAQYRAALEVRP